MFAYLLYPLTAVPMLVATNDGLVAALVLWALVLAGRPALRGVMLASAALTKFAPALLCVAFLRSERRWVRYLAGALAAAALVMLPTVLDPGLGVFLNRTFTWQASRGVSFSAWGYLPHAAVLLGRPLLALALLALAAASMLRPRAFTIGGYAALASGGAKGRQSTASRLLVLRVRHLVLPVAAARAYRRKESRRQGGGSDGLNHRRCAGSTLTRRAPGALAGAREGLRGQGPASYRAVRSGARTQVCPETACESEGAARSATSARRAQPSRKRLRGTAPRTHTAGGTLAGAVACR